MAYEFDPVVPESTESIYKRELARVMPDVKRQRSQEFEFINRQMQRMGVVNPGQMARQSVNPWAEAIGKVGAQAGATAETIGRQERETAERLNIQRENMQLQQQQWEQQLAEMQASRQQQGQLGLLPYTGFTPEMLELLGMEDTFSRGGLGDWRQFQRTLGQYNLPGQPMGGGGQPQQLTAQQRLQLSMFYPGASRSYKAQAASNWGWTPQDSPYY